MKSNLLSHCCHISLCGSIIIWCIAGLCCTLCTPCNAEWCQRTSWCHKHQPQIWSDKEMSLVMMFVFLTSFDSEDKGTEIILDLHRTNYCKFSLFYKSIDYTTSFVAKTWTRQEIFPHYKQKTASLVNVILSLLPRSGSVRTLTHFKDRCYFRYSTVWFSWSMT